ncbi:MAG: hypothetical protein KBB55_01950 [Candidatus Buchananbacteria bacterium]|nr:hypothetical protein [Candidatus Buchananbacteria bacterium]
MIQGKASIELLTHFCCEECKKWWAIGDAPQRDTWYCPWCGTQQEMIVAKNVPRGTEHE